MHRRLLLSLLMSSLALTACSSTMGNAPLNQTQPTQQLTAKPVLSSALLKRPLQLANINGMIQPIAAVMPVSDGSFSIQQVSTPGSMGSGLVMPVPISARADAAISRPAIAPGYYYGGHDFNQYMIQFAEENMYKAATGTTLLNVYNQDIKPILSEWDSAGRLIESRANIGGAEEEWIQLPGKEGEPLRLRPNFVFRFASSAKKETLNIYVLSNEIRVHRMVWGEPSIAIDKVQIDSDKAVEIARKAFADRTAKPGYPVYPEVAEKNMDIIYEIPTDLKWNVQLNQQDRNQIRYFVNFNYQKQVQGSGPMPKPVPMPEPMIAESQAAPDTPVSNVARTTVAVAPAYPDSYMQHYYGSAEIDAVTGAIKSLNRPVYYSPYPMPMYDNGSTGSSSGGGTVAVDAGPAVAAK